MVIKRIWSRVKAPFELFYWRMTLPLAQGVKLLIEHEGKFLMIRETLGKQHWTFPGGRMKDWETPEIAARRKAREEVGVTLTYPTYIGSYFHTRQYKKDAIGVFYEKVPSSDYRIHDSSIIEANWFTLLEMERLEHSESVEDVIELFRRSRTNARI